MSARRIGFSLVVLLALLAFVALLGQGGRSDEPHSPYASGPRGSLALAQVLRASGVAVTVVPSASALRDAAPGPGTTVLVTQAAELFPDQLVDLRAALGAPDRLVLDQPGSRTLRGLDLPVEADAGTDRGTYTAACSGASSPAGDAVVAAEDRLNAPTEVYTRSGTVAARTCFPGQGAYAEGAGAVLTLAAASGRPETVLLGSEQILANRYLDEDTNAGIALRATGNSSRLLWYDPRLATGDDGPAIAPAWFLPAAVLLGGAVLVLALVRGRRLGALVPEDLPVVVRAVETTQSRAALYRRSADRGRAARVLRLSTERRVRRRLGVPADVSDAELVGRVATASGLPADSVAGLLRGPAPVDDATLLELARELSALEERVHHP